MANAVVSDARIDSLQLVNCACMWSSAVERDAATSGYPGGAGLWQSR
jgi:hypothetical protein